MKEYTKKVPVFDERSSATARADRLRRLRNIANLSREQFCKNSGIAMATLKRWELAYYGGLPVDGAKKIIECVAQEGIICSLEWLLHEIGVPPSIDPQFIKKSALFKPCGDASNKTWINFDEEEKFIINELLLFRKNHHDAIDLRISDDGLFPKYNINDYVAGVQVSLDSIDSLLCQDCIVQLQQGQILLRNLRKGFQANQYNLICTNEQTTVKEPILYNVNIAMISVILRHYKKPSSRLEEVRPCL